MLKKALTLATTAAIIFACSQGEGSGTVSGTLNVPNCWTGQFDLAPDFYAGEPVRDSLEIRIQNGSDYETFSDGVAIQIYDITKIRPNGDTAFAGTYGQPLKVSLPPEVTPPGVPVKADADPANISLSLYMQKSCRTQNVSLYAVEEVSIPTDGTCDAKAIPGTDPSSGCDPNVTTPAGVGTGKSLIAFKHVFNGKADEPTAAERLTEGCFDVYLADPREVGAGGLGPPPRCRGHIKGSFSFIFERGRPSQPFP